MQIRFCKCLTFWKVISRNYSCLFPNVPTNKTQFIKRLQKYQKSLISCEIRLLMELLGRFELPTSSLPTAIRPFYRTFSGVISCYYVLNKDFPELWCSQIILFYPFCSRIVPRKSSNLFPNCSQSDNLNRIYPGYIYYLIPLFPILYRYKLTHNIMSNKFNKAKHYPLRKVKRSIWINKTLLFLYASWLNSCPIAIIFLLCSTRLDPNKYIISFWTSSLWQFMLSVFRYSDIISFR